MNDQKLLSLIADAQSQVLSRKDMTIVKEGWNKALAWRDRLFFEAFAERWFFLCPKVVSRLGKETEDIIAFLYGWVDLAVQSLLPETAVINRETYQAVHLDGKQRFFSLDRYASQLVVLGVSSGGLVALDEAWYFALKMACPYFEETDELELRDRNKAPLVRMFRQLILNAYAESVNSQIALVKNLGSLGQAWDDLVAHGSLHQEVELGRHYNRFLLTSAPHLADYFVQSNVDDFAALVVRQVLGTLRNLKNQPSLTRFWALTVPALHEVGEMHHNLLFPAVEFECVKRSLLALVQQELPSLISPKGSLEASLGRLLELYTSVMAFPTRYMERLHAEADDFFEQAAEQFKWTAAALSQRKFRALRELQATGTHTLTSEELSLGAQLAWRNSGKCVGRVSWNTLLVRDKRNIIDPETVFAECVEHQRLATAGTNLQSVMTVFAARVPGERWGLRIWNSQFVRFACWRMEDGSTLGDPANLKLTDKILKTFPEWQCPEKKSAFDALPLVIEAPGLAPLMFEVPPECLNLVDIVHPTAEGIASLGMKWCPVPTITDFNLRVAGVDFVCCPFNGWFLDLEVTRNLFERYNAAELWLPFFPELESRRAHGDSSWLDVIFNEICRAVHHSFSRSGKTIVDRPTVVRQFAVHKARERDAGREVAVQWSWVGGLLGPVYAPWHSEGRDFLRYPRYEYQSHIWAVAPNRILQALKAGPAVARRASVFNLMKAGSRRWLKQAKTNAQLAREQGVTNVPTVVILFGSETGTAESYAVELAGELRLLAPRVAPLSAAAPGTELGNQLLDTDFVLVVTSTFGAGGPPFNAEKFLPAPKESGGGLPDLSRGENSKGPVRYAVCGIGSSVYPEFCSYGRQVFQKLRESGATPVVEFATADEMGSQRDSFRSWLSAVTQVVLPPALARALRYIAPAPERTVVISEPPTGGEQELSPPTKYVPQPREQFAVLTVKSNRELRQAAAPEEGRSTCRLEIDVSPLGAGVYTTGDHLSVLPVRSEEAVASLCALLGVKPSHVVRGLSARKKAATEAALEAVAEDAAAAQGTQLVLGGEEYEVTGPAVGLSVAGSSWREVFSVSLETVLHTSFLAPLLEVVLQSAADAEDSRVPGLPVDQPDAIAALRDSLGAIKEAADPRLQRLQQLLLQRGSGGNAPAPAGTTDGEEEKEAPALFPRTQGAFIDRFLTLEGLLTALPGTAARLDLAKLLSVLPRARARFYSISSSSAVSPDVVAITVGLVLEPTSQGTIRKGVCSSYLCGLSAGDQLLATVRASAFRLPEHQALPVLCVGPGTGFAPFAGFLDERAATAVASGDCCALLLTGARTSGDAIYLAESEAWKQQSEGRVRVLLALSREGAQPARVPDLMQRPEVAEELVRLLWDQGGYFYVCGDARMSDDVTDALRNVLMAVKGLSKLAAFDEISRLRESGRFQLDVWGVTSFFTRNALRFMQRKEESMRERMQMIAQGF